MNRILVTTTSFQDTPGPHHKLLQETGWEIITARGPLNEADTLALVGDIDGYICGDDMITRKVLEKARPRLRILSKYGIGVDKIDIAAATEMVLPVLFTPGVNHTTVAEHTFALLLALVRNLVDEANFVRSGNWKRMTGHEIMGRRLGIFGLGRIGKEVAIRAKAFAMEVAAYDLYWDEDFARIHGIERITDLDSLIYNSDILSLHANLTPETHNLINLQRLSRMRDGAIILNCARGELVESGAVAHALKMGKLAGYAADVLEEEPPRADHPLLTAPNCIITPHIGSRTHQSVGRQATKAVQNLILAMNGQKPLAQVNQVPIPQP